MNGAAKKTGIEIQLKNANGEWEQFGFTCHSAVQIADVVAMAKSRGEFRVWSNNANRDVTAAWS